MKSLSGLGLRRDGLFREGIDLWREIPAARCLFVSEREWVAVVDHREEGASARSLHEHFGLGGDRAVLARGVAGLAVVPGKFDSGSRWSMPMMPVR